METYNLDTLNKFHAFRIFQSRNYQLYFGGQLVSLTGNWMTQTATVWLVYQLTHSPAWLGWVVFAGQLPTLLLAPLAGVWVDRWDRFRILKLTQVGSMLQSFALAAIVFSGWLNIGILMTLAVVQGIINAFDMPARQTFAIILAEKREHLAAVIGMNSSMFHLARLVGPAVGGVIIAMYGAGFCFLMDGLSYVAVLVALLMMRFPPVIKKEEPAVVSVWSSFHEGIRYAFGFGPIRFLILLCGGIALFGASYTVLVPVYAEKIFSGDARTLGILMSCSAAGSVVATFYLSARYALKGIGSVIVFGAFLMGCALIGFAWSRIFPLSMFCLLGIGAGGILVMAASNTLLQNLVDENKRGRVMSLFGSAFFGGTLFGSLLAGSIAEWIGVSWTTTLSAIVCLGLGGLLKWHLPRLREDAHRMMARHEEVPLQTVH